MEKCRRAAGKIACALRAANSLFLVLGMLLGLSISAHAVSLGDIVTVAGGGVGDNGPAVSATISPDALAFDSVGNLYIADSTNHRIRKVDFGSGIITTVAGNGSWGFSGDGMSAASASLYEPNGIAFDSAGNLYIADTRNNRIRKIDAVTGIITTVAGNGTGSFSGDNGIATSASLYGPHGIAIDGTGNLYIADIYNNRIRKVAAGSGIITTVAGNGTAEYSGDNSAAVSAGLGSPTGVALDSAGNLYIADFGNHRIRKVDAATGIITTVAGNGVQSFAGDGGSALSASLNYPHAIAIDSAGNLNISDELNNRIRKVTIATGVIDTIVGNGTGVFSGDNGSAVSASLADPKGIAFDSAGNLYVADAVNRRIRKVSAAGGIITTVAGNGSPFFGDNIAATSAALFYGQAIAADKAGNIYFSDAGILIRKVEAVTGIISTVAGNGTHGYSGDNGIATSAALDSAYGLAVDDSGNIYIADRNNHRIRRVDSATGIITTVAGNGVGAYSGDNGAAISASLWFPTGVAVDSAGNLYIADQWNHRIRRVDSTTGIITTVAGNGTASFSGDNGAATAAGLFNPAGVTVDGDGNLYIADLDNLRIRKVMAATGIITTVAGNGDFMPPGDNGLATSASVGRADNVAVDSNGNIYIKDRLGIKIRKVAAATGIITTVAGGGSSFGENAPALSAEIGPSCVALDRTGNLYFIDWQSNRIRKVYMNPEATATTVLSSISPSVFGTSVTFTATVTSNDGIPGGTVTFMDGATVLGNAALDSYGQATMSTSILAVGSHTITAVYSATGIYNTSSSVVLVQTVNSNITSRPFSCSKQASGSITFSSGGSTTFQCSLDGATYAPCTSPFSYSGLANGQHSLLIRAVDESGNLSVPVNYGWTVNQGQMLNLGDIVTVAGGGAGDNVVATSASLFEPHSVAVDNAGNLFIADFGNNRIRKVAAGTGVISTVAGNGASGFFGDNGPATSASLFSPYGVAVDNTGNLYIADLGNYRVRKVTSGTGIISTLAGNGTNGFSGDNGPATLASLKGPIGVAVDSMGNVYIAESGSDRIRKVDVATGVITTVAGNGAASFSGDNGAATAASISGPRGVTVDGAGNIFIADTGYNRIRKVEAATGIITTVAGNGTAGVTGDNGLAIDAGLKNPTGIAVDSAGNIYIAQEYNHRIRKVSAATGIITTVAGNGVGTFAGDLGPAPSSGLYYPYGLATDPAGNLYVADQWNQRVRMIAGETGIIRTVAGNGERGFYGDNGSGTSANLGLPEGIAFDSFDNLYIADYGNSRVRKVAADTGIITSVAGNGTAGFSGDNDPATVASIYAPKGVAVDHAANLFISDNGNNLIRKVDAITGIITTVVGDGAFGFSGDNGIATSASIGYPTGLVADSGQNLYLTDNYNYRIRKVSSSTGIITTVVGNGTSAFFGDYGFSTSASLKFPTAVSLDNAENLYIADFVDNRIRRVETGTGIITTVAGTGVGGYSGDNGPAIVANINTPGGLSVDNAGNLYFADVSNHRIRMVAATTGIINTVAGNGIAAFSGDNGAATSASLNSPGGVAVDSVGNLYIADTTNNRIRKVYLNPVATVTSLTSSAPANASVFGTPATFTATVTSNDGIPGGTVTFMDGALPLGSAVLDESGQATFSTSFLTVGSHTITAVYGLAGIYNTSTSNGVIHSVNAPPATPPSASTDTVTAISTTGVTLNGWAGSNGAISTISFDYGLTTGYGSTVTAAQSPLAANADGPVSAAISGLACGTTYHFRITGQNSTGTTTSPDATFTTTACPTPGNAIITTIAGNGEQTFAGDGGPGTSASLYYPYGVARDSAGNIYIADTFNYRIRKLAAGTGVISTVAGVSTSGFSGDGGSAIAAEINCPYGVAVDSAGNIYIADTYNNRIRKVDAVTGIITTVAGNGSGTFAGDGGLAASASINNPVGVTVDSLGNLYISDTNNNRIRRVDAATGIITTVAGTGSGSFSGDGGPSASAGIYRPYGIALDDAGNIYFADYMNLRIRKIDKATGIISTVAGKSATGMITYTGEGGPATSATLPSLHGITVDHSGTIFITEANSSRILKVDAASGIISTVAGNGVWDFSGDGGEAIAASLKAPTGVVVDSAGNLYIADTSNHRIRSIIVATSSRILLPQTGQSICLDGIGVEQPCVNMPGHDGAVRAGVEWPVPRFNNNGDQTITDNLTGLQWTQNANAPATGSCTGGTNMAWNDALAYVACLNSSGYLGHNDWRMPNVNELFSMINVSKYYSSASAWLAGQGFTNVIDGYHWSSTSHIFSPASAWGVAVTLGDTQVFEKTLPCAVWPVRGGAPGTGTVSLPATGQSICYDHNGAEISCAGSGQDGELKKGIAAPVVRFMPNANQTNTDTFTGLVWARDASVPTVGACTGGSEGKTWSAALDYINCLNSANYLGYSDWRMPNMQEMMSMYVRGIESQTRLWQVGFTISTTTATSSTSVYWTSTSHSGPTGMAWTVSMYDGWVNGDFKDKFNFVWPVRGDITPPVITTSGPLRYSNQTSGTIAFTANESATFQCSFDGSSYATCTSPFSYSSLANGLHTLAIKATDQAGNASLPFNKTWTVNTSLSASSAVLLPQTGQTTCNNAAGATIACAGTGQDGDVQAGMPWPNQRFTDNGNQTMTDVMTGLIWTKDANLMATRNPTYDSDVYAQDGAVTWQHALDYIMKLNTENYLGYTDWRLPNIRELASLVNNGQTDLVLWLGNSQGFTNVPSTNYNSFWSSTSGSNRSTARIASLAIGQLSNMYKTDFAYVWAIRGSQTGLLAIPRTGQSSCYDESGASRACSGTGEDGEMQSGVAWPTPRFTDNKVVDNNDATVTDNLTGLIWANDGNLAARQNTWQGALSYVAALNQNNYMGHSDWRLPNRNELESLTNLEETVQADWLNSQGFSLLQPFWCWSASSVAGNVTNAYDLGLGDGSVGVLNKVYNDYVWPVRGGFAQTFQRLTATSTGNGSGTITSSPAGINCGVTCLASFVSGQTVALTAAPAAGILFGGWTGCDSVDGATCTVAMNGAKNVTAVFSNVAPPAAPTNIEVKVPTVKGQLTLMWTNPTDPDFNHVHVYRSTAPGQLGILAGDNVTGIQYINTSLASQTAYYYTVRSVDTAGNESTNTAQVFGTTLDSIAPAPATGVTVGDAATGGRLNITWINPTERDFASVTIYRSSTSSQPNYTTVVSQVTGTAYSDTSLTNGRRYYYVIRAFDTSGNYSDTVQYSGIPTAPDTTPPGVISCTGTITQPLPLTGDKLQLNWANPADSDYALTRVYASTDASLGTLVYQGTGTGYLHTGLTAGATYNYTYRTVDTAGNETSNTGYCSYTPVDQTAPACPTELNAVRNIDDTVTLSWNRSASPDIHSYQIFAGAADAVVSYAAPTATVISPTVTWTSGLLTQGKTYQFGIRTVDSLLTSPNVSGNCGVISVAIPNPAPACDVSASIKVPQTGKKLGGNRTSVIAEITSGSESSLASVRFQYRVSGIANSWLNVPSTDPVNFPNPDTLKPWFVHWDISGLTDNSDYDIRAVATCTNTAQDATPNYITVAVNKGDPDSDEDDNTDGEHRKTEKVGGEADSHIVKGDTDDTRVTTLTLPAQSVPEGVRVTVTESNPATKAALVPSDHGNVGTFREISFDDGRHLLDNSKKAELTVPYKDDNNDGIADGTAINVHDLQVCDYDSVGGRWNCLDSTVDTAAKTVKAKTATFSLFGLLAPPKPLVAGWNLVSVPLTPSPATAASVFGAGAFFYNPATGAYPAASTIEAGKAYWVRNGFTSIKATGTETPDSSFSIPIKRGWNLIGNPFRYKVNVNDLQIANGSTVAIAVAETNGWAVGTLFNYSNGSYQMSSHQDDGVLEPWKGYWILSDINGTLIVPNTPAH